MNAELTILLVEDNPGDVALTRAALKQSSLQCHICVARDGSQALDFLHGKRAGEERLAPDLILLDINMPRMDGKQLLSVLKTDKALKTIPVVMFTSSDSPADITDCFERHASSYIVKPFDGRKYGDAVRQIVSFWGDLSERPGK